jgi:hypothetical protein
VPVSTFLSKSTVRSSERCLTAVRSGRAAEWGSRDVVAAGGDATAGSALALGDDAFLPHAARVIEMARAAIRTRLR